MCDTALAITLLSQTFKGSDRWSVISDQWPAIRGRLLEGDLINRFGKLNRGKGTDSEDAKNFGWSRFEPDREGHGFSRAVQSEERRALAPEVRWRLDVEGL
jgi:hypothetical protein